MNENKAELKFSRVMFVMNELKAKQGKQINITTLVKTFPVPSGKSFNFVKPKPKRIINTLLHIAIHKFIELRAPATLVPMSFAKETIIITSDAFYSRIKYFATQAELCIINIRNLNIIYSKKL